MGLKSHAFWSEKSCCFLIFSLDLLFFSFWFGLSYEFSLIKLWIFSFKVFAFWQNNELQIGIYWCHWLILRCETASCKLHNLWVASLWVVRLHVVSQRVESCTPNNLPITILWGVSHLVHKLRVMLDCLPTVCTMMYPHCSKPNMTQSKRINSFMTEAVIIQKPVHWFAEQINGLISTW